jgi:hypothetical protein
MTRTRRVLVPLCALVLAAAPTGLSAARSSSRCSLEILVDGQAAREYRVPGATYVEAVKGRPYEIRVHNPFDVRVAVALSVDGLNTIDARHTTADAARKWVIGPHDTITITGWQTSMSQARRFFFTSEERSYAARIGQPQNAGVISAVFFRERVAPLVMPFANRQDAETSPHRDRPAAPPAAGAATAGASAAKAEAAGAARDEYAATGIGDRTAHPVQLVSLDLEATPAAAIDIRYEYRGQLVRLGVLPDAPPVPDPLVRRQGARGFDKGFCPDIR